METKLEIKGQEYFNEKLFSSNSIYNRAQCLNKLSKDKTIRIFQNQNKNLYPESKLVCHRHTMILIDNACFKAKTFLGKITPPQEYETLLSTQWAKEG